MIIEGRKVGNKALKWKKFIFIYSENNIHKANRISILLKNGITPEDEPLESLVKFSQLLINGLITIAKIIKEGGLLRFSQNFPGQVEQKWVKYL